MTSTTTDRLAGTTASLASKAPVRVATPAGQNLGLSGLGTVDGVLLVADDRVLVKSQTDGIENGVYDVKAGAWTRSLDFNGARDVVSGTFVVVAGGTVGAGTAWRISTANPITIGTTSIAFTRAVWSSADGVEVIATGSTTARSLALRFADVFNVLDYGAVGDSIVDDTAAIQAAFDAVGNDGGVVFFPPGTYLISDWLLPDSNTTIWAYGATILVPAGGAGSNNIVIRFQNSESGLRVYGLKIDATAADTHGFWLNTGTSDIIIEDCEHQSTAGVRHGVQIRGASRVTVKHNEFHDTNAGVSISGACVDIRVEDNYLHDLATQGVRVGEGAITGNILRLWVDRNYIFNTGGQNSPIIMISFNGSTLVDIYVRGNRIQGIIGLSFANQGSADLIACRDVTRLVVSDNITTDGGDSGLAVDRCDFVTVTGNITRNNNRNGINLADCDYFSCVGNTSINNGLDFDGDASTLGSSVGIMVSNIGTPASSFGIVNGNTCSDTNAVGSKKQTYGVYIRDNLSGSGVNANIDVGPNMVEGNKWGGYASDQTGASAPAWKTTSVSDETIPTSEDFPLHYRHEHRNPSTTNPLLSKVSARVKTTLAASEPGLETVLNCTTTAGMTAGDNIGVGLDSGATHWTTIVSIAAPNVTITTGIPTAAASGNTVLTNTWATLLLAV